MGSDAHVIVVGGPAGLIGHAVKRIEELERRWSRFLPDSEVSQLNRWAGLPVAVSIDTITLVEHAMVAWRLSGGAYDPTVLGAVMRAGYDRSFEFLDCVNRGDDFDPPRDRGRGAHAMAPGADAIVVGRETVTLPAGTAFDPGGIGKGLAADMVSAEILAAGAEGICVNLGGDAKVAGQGPNGSGWTVAIEHPWLPAPFAHVGLGGGGVATSSTLRRRWQHNGHTRHHLIDPHTGRPSGTDVNLATVIAQQAWVAEVLAKAVLLAGTAHPFDTLGGTGAQALAVDHHGVVHATPGMADYLGEATLPALLARA